MNILNLIGRNKKLFEKDVQAYSDKIKSLVESSKFLVLGGAGSIGQAVTKEIFKRNPLKLHVVDISENNLVELVRDLRSSHGYIDGDFRTFAIDIGSLEYHVYFENEGDFDYVLNLSALKHVRSEKDPYTLMRMIETNIFNTEKTIDQAVSLGAQKYFCVSTDKAANPVNLMGASKRIMEMFLMQRSQQIQISTARFANVAFSDGSLLHGFNQRIAKKQPIVAPRDVKRYFVTSQESGELCLMSCLFGENGDIYFPKLSENLHLISFAEIAKKYLIVMGYAPFECSSEDEARELIGTLPEQGKWPCLFTLSDTTGEKDFEEFYTDAEVLDLNTYSDLGVIKNNLDVEKEKLEKFKNRIEHFKEKKSWTKKDLIELFNQMLPELDHQEKGKFLDSKM
ncbi:UDP-N-acetylglucosamine 4,6-dehydratase [Nonlabens spongiae]|uniref:UDP-N-acetylglucosamine 4,6-dehydratase n=1 Tax=Nonlabens spongiae TaxID=331648 RepID=UPI000A2699BC|nr:UDP-N-acetylglucosamine 4,6-dehydratase [Nonlabens spongiae]